MKRYVWIALFHLAHTSFKPDIIGHLLEFNWKLYLDLSDLKFCDSKFTANIKIKLGLLTST